MIIACPKCDFRPTPNILWICRPGCGTRWHTFATHGVCPGCSKFWHDTCCPRCRLWSPHDDWYRDDVPDQQEKRRLPRKQEDPAPSINQLPDPKGLPHFIPLCGANPEFGFLKPLGSIEEATPSINRIPDPKGFSYFDPVCKADPGF